ncbi:MAG: M23 family metallopeptidase [Rhodospirillales bacterium]|nr:M23 family metallopeptidase [Rhodospirillales bacterium]
MGPRDTGIAGASKNHGGIDMRAAVGTPLVAQGPAQVAYAGPSGGYGQAVILNHGQGVFTLYGHVEPNMPAKTGQMLKKGDRFAVTGDEGIGSAHLHYEVLLMGKDGKAYRVDPEKTIGKDLSDPQTRQNLIAQAEDKMGVNVSKLASRAFDARVSENLKHDHPALVAQNPAPAPPAVAVATAEKPATSSPRLSAATKIIGDWMEKKVENLSASFQRNATTQDAPASTTAKADPATPRASEDKPAATAAVAAATPKSTAPEEPKAAAALAPA